MLTNVETRLSDVQRDLKAVLPPDCILVGQGLNNDLIALRLMHPYVIDTSVIFNVTGNRRRKSKLSALSNIFLNEAIQTSGKLGHNPEEDAKAAMKLVKLKLAKGYEFGDVMLNGFVPQIPALVKSDESDDRVLALDISKELERHDKKVVQCGSIDKVISDRSSHLIMCHVEPDDDDNDDDPLKRKKKARKAAEKVWASTEGNSMLISVWSGNADENAFVGISLKKDPLNSELI